MTRALARINFHSSELIRCLADLDMISVVDAGEAFAEKLGQWIHFVDAITLSAMHNDCVASLPATRAGAQVDACTSIAVEFHQIQTTLANSIMKSCSPSAGNTPIALPTPEAGLPMNTGTAYTPYRRFYEAHQRDMEPSVQRLRVNVRYALTKASSRLKTLAELDAVMEKMLRERESKLLAKVPVLLKKRFEFLYEEHQQKFTSSQQTDNPAAWMKPGGWLARFCKDMQMLLLAEAELRLQPAMGLIEALREETKQAKQ